MAELAYTNPWEPLALTDTLSLDWNMRLHQGGIRTHQLRHRPYGNEHDLILGWHEVLERRSVGGLVVACFNRAERTIIPWDEVVVGQIHAAARWRKPVFTEVSPNDMTLPAESITGMPMSEILQEARIVTIGTDDNCMTRLLQALRNPEGTRHS